MKAAFYENQGDPYEVLQIGEVLKPSPGKGEVLVKIAVSGLNPSDIRVRTGSLGAMAFSRIIPHQDGSGTIEAVGEGIDPARLNERVWIYQAQYGRSSGTAAEYVVVPSGQAILLPVNTTFEVGASLGVPAITAHNCLFADGDIRGKRVLVQGGAGAVGEAAVQLAKYAGAWVAATVRNLNDAQKIRSMGADLVIDISTEDIVTEINNSTDGKGVDRIVEVDLVSNLEPDLKILNNSGTISIYALKTGEKSVSIPVFNAMIKNNAFRFVYVYTISDEAKMQAIEMINACLESSQYSTSIGLIVPLNEIARAHEALETKSVKGKILIHVNASA